MRIDGLHEKELFSKAFPFRLIINENIDFDYPLHWHNAIELLYVMQNDFAATVNSDTYTLKEGDLLFIPSGDLHGFKGVTKTGRRIFINFELSSLSFFDDINQLLGRLCDVRHISPNENSLYAPIVSEIEKMLGESDETNQLFFVARMIDILLVLSRGKYAGPFPAPEIAGRKSAGLERINKSFQFISENYRKNITLKDAAQAVGFSEFYFSRLFKEITEKSFHQYLNEFRVKKAKMMLMDSDCTVAQAAYTSGFSSITTFDRLFRKLNGISPQEFRKFKA